MKRKTLFSNVSLAAILLSLVSSCMASPRDELKAGTDTNPTESTVTDIKQPAAELVRIPNKPLEKNSLDPENFSKIEILRILEDNPLKREPYLLTEGNFSAWLIKAEIFDAFNAILNEDIYRDDPDIRSRLLELSETHPFTDIRTSALLLLSEYQGNNNILRRLQVFWHQDGYKGVTRYQINEQMEYCAPPQNARRPDFEIEAEREAEALKLGRPRYRFEVPMQYGTVSGGYYSIRGIGLTYKQNAAPHKTVGISNTNNRYVMESDSRGGYWLIDGPHHMMGGATISKLLETQDGIDRYLHRILPGSVSQIFELSDGRIFITFVNLDPSKRGGTHKDGEFIPSPLERYNPPVIFHPNGKISLACSPDSVEF